MCIENNYLKKFTKNNNNEKLLSNVKFPFFLRTLLGTVKRKKQQKKIDKINDNRHLNERTTTTSNVDIGL